MIKRQKHLHIPAGWVVKIEDPILLLAGDCVKSFFWNDEGKKSGRTFPGTLTSSADPRATSVGIVFDRGAVQQV